MDAAIRRKGALPAWGGAVYMTPSLDTSFKRWLTTGFEDAEVEMGRATS
jgi:hypothetical protein